MSANNVAPEPSEDFLEFMELLERGGHLELFEGETFPKGTMSKEEIRELSSKYPFSGINTAE